jgi:CheY-like chemotaxis protein
MSGDNPVAYPPSNEGLMNMASRLFSESHEFTKRLLEGGLTPKQMEILLTGMTFGRASAYATHVAWTERGVTDSPFERKYDEIKKAVETTSQKLLIVDDDFCVRKSLGTYFDDTGYTIVNAIDGEAGWEAIEQARPGIVFLDNQMPRMSGHELAKRVRETPGLRGAYLVGIGDFREGSVPMLDELVFKGEKYFGQRCLKAAERVLGKCPKPGE